MWKLIKENWHGKPYTFSLNVCYIKIDGFGLRYFLINCVCILTKYFRNFTSNNPLYFRSRTQKYTQRNTYKPWNSVSVQFVWKFTWIVQTTPSLEYICQRLCLKWDIICTQPHSIAIIIWILYKCGENSNQSIWLVGLLDAHFLWHVQCNNYSCFRTFS